MAADLRDASQVRVEHPLWRPWTLKVAPLAAPDPPLLRVRAFVVVPPPPEAVRAPPTTESPDPREVIAATEPITKEGMVTVPVNVGLANTAKVPEVGKVTVVAPVSVPAKL